MPIDYSLYLVTDRNILGNSDLFKAVEDSIKGGATVVQLREKDISSLEFYNLAMKLKEIVHRYNVPLIINDRLDIAMAADADGLHIGQEDLPIEVARRLWPGKILGYSVSNIAEALHGQKQGADYLGVGPVYATGSKADAGKPIGAEMVKQIKQRVSVPVVGIGGIGLSNIDEIKETGIEGISVISAILENKDIQTASRNLINSWKM